MSSHAASKLVSLFKALARRYERLLRMCRELHQQQQSGISLTSVPEATPAAATPASASGILLLPPLGSSLPDLEAEAAIVEDFLRVVLGAVATMLASGGGAQRNAELVYALLQRQEAFDALAATLEQQRQLRLGVGNGSSGGGSGGVRYRAPLGGDGRGLSGPLSVVREALSFFSKRLEDALAEEQQGGGGGPTGAEWDVARMMRVVTAAALFWRPPPPGRSQEGGTGEMRYVIAACGAPSGVGSLLTLLLHLICFTYVPCTYRSPDATLSFMTQVYIRGGRASRGLLPALPLGSAAAPRTCALG